MKKRYFSLFLLSFIAVVSSYSLDQPPTVFFLDSYHEGYEWSDRIIQGFLDGIESEDLKLVIHRMDSKRNPSEEYLKAEALRVKHQIEILNPDVIIACDDNASQYVVEPYFRDNDIPVVFCGVNWDPSTYGYPWKNATGMVEVNLVEELLIQLAKYTNDPDPRIGYLASDTNTERKEAAQYKTRLGIELTRELYVENLEEWKAGFLEIQDDVDILIIGTFIYADDEGRDVEDFVKDNIRIPTGTLNDFLMPYALVGYMKNPEEFGYWSARTALEILGGRDPSDIPIVENELSELILNMVLADRLDLIFGIDLLRHATIIR